MDDIDAFGIPGFREPVNCFTHLFAACVFSVWGYYLVRRGRGSWSRMVSLGVMVSTSVFLLSMSGVFHLLGPGAGRHIMRQLDIAGILLWRRYGFSFVKPLLWGGMAYTLGAIVLSLNWPTIILGVIGAHELWHVAVLIGLGLHWKFVFQFADGLPQAPYTTCVVDHTEGRITLRKRDEHERKNRRSEGPH